MARIIAVANQKGGVGKTTTSVNLAAGLALKGQRVLAIDMDMQGNLSSHLGLHVEKLKIHIGDALLSNRIDLIDMAWKLTVGDATIHVAPSNLGLEETEGRLLTTGLVGLQLLKRKIAPLRDQFDFIIIDCPPATNTLTRNALVAATEVLAPVATDIFSLMGLQKLQKTIHELRPLNPELSLSYILATRVERTKLAKDMLGTLHEQFETQILSTVIRKNVKLQEAATEAEPIFTYDSESNGAQDYGLLCDEVLKWHARR